MLMHSANHRSERTRERFGIGARRRPARNGGQAMVEFALLAPLGFLLLISIVVVGIIVTNYVQLTNEARDGARVAAICGSVQGTPMPDGSPGGCTGINVAAYITNHLVALPAGTVKPQIYVCLASQAAQCSTLGTPCSTSALICNCQPTRIVEVDMSYDQPLYVPIVSNVFQTNVNGTRHLTASAQATCEQ